VIGQIEGGEIAEVLLIFSIQGHHQGFPQNMANFAKNLEENLCSICMCHATS
jgi:hypothetical protein